MSIPVPCAVLLLAHPSCLKAGVLWPAQAMPLGLCNRLASMQSLLCGDAGIKAYEAASCKCQILSLCPSMHPSIYSCGEGSDLKGRGRDSVVEFRAAESCVGEGCGSGGLLVSLRPKRSLWFTWALSTSVHWVFVLDPLSPLSPSPFQMVGVDTEGLCCYLCPPVCPWGQGFSCLLI